MVSRGSSCLESSAYADSPWGLPAREVFGVSGPNLGRISRGGPFAREALDVYSEIRRRRCPAIKAAQRQTTNHAKRAIAERVTRRGFHARALRYGRSRSAVRTRRTVVTCSPAIAVRCGTSIGMRRRTGICVRHGTGILTWGGTTIVARRYAGIDATAIGHRCRALVGALGHHAIVGGRVHPEHQWMPREPAARTGRDADHAPT